MSKPMVVEKKLGTLELVKRHVKLRGLTPIMFDRYPGDNTTALAPHQKLYFSPEQEGVIGVPAENISSFLSSENTTSAAKRLGIKRWKAVAQACLSFVTIAPQFIPLMREGAPVRFGGKFVSDFDPVGKIRVHRCVARLKNGVPNPKERPVVDLPWSIEFELTLYPTPEIREETLRDLFERGGIAIGLGTFRGVFGKFEVVGWE